MKKGNGHRATGNGQEERTTAGQRATGLPRTLLPVACCLLPVLLAGCAPPIASLDMLAQASRALDLSGQTITVQGAELAKGLDFQQKSLDAAFDADVRLAAAGQIADANGTPVKLTADWVISARKGYTAAAGIVMTNRANLDRNQSVALDNVQAGKDMLDKIRTLVIMQTSLDANLKGWLLGLPTMKGPK